MWRKSSVVCKSCHNHNHCAECSAYFATSITNKVFEPKSVAKKYPHTYKKVALMATLHNLNEPATCTYCNSKHCHTCSMYNSHFETEIKA